MPELGDYAFHVVACYVVTIGGLAVLVGMTVRRARRVAAQLAEVEANE